MSKLPTLPSTETVELAKYCDGYPALGAWMACDPDEETLIFRRFSNLAARNLLHLQAQIVALEEEVLDADAVARGSKEGLSASMRHETLIRLSKDRGRPEFKRVQNMQRLKDLLKDYYEALLQRAQISRLQRPSERSLAAAEDFVAGSGAMKNLEGSAKDYLKLGIDLVALNKPVEEDYATRIVHACWPTQNRRSIDPIDRTLIYKNSSIARTVETMSFILAATLLIGAIVHLYFVEDQAAKLGFVAMYTLLFAASVTFCTTARRAEVFAATAAYAAVLVVFVSGDLGGTKTEQCLIQLQGGIFKVVQCPG